MSLAPHTAAAFELLERHPMSVSQLVSDRTDISCLIFRARHCAANGPVGSAAAASGGSTRLVAAGAAAQAELEWTGELAGHDSERASLVVVQLAAEQVPVRVAADIADVPDEASVVDIGMSATIRLGPFEPRP